MGCCASSSMAAVTAAPPPSVSGSPSKSPVPAAAAPAPSSNPVASPPTPKAQDNAAYIEHEYVEHTFASRWKMGKKLGEGAFATVHLCTNLLDPKRVAAVKIMDITKMSRKDHDGAKREVDIMRKLQHPNIVQFLDYFDEGAHIYVVLEYLRGGELFDRVIEKEHYSEKEARDTIFIFLSALKYIHDKNIVHRDLKPENLLMASEADDADIKVADFGLSIEDNGTLKESCGSPSYMAPELLLLKPYGKPVDMWALGVIAYILMGGYPPFDQADEKSVKAGKYEFHPDSWSHVSDAAKHFIRGLLTVDPSKRLTVHQALEDPWVTTAAEDLAGRNLATSLTRFKEFHGKRKLKGAVKSVMAVNRMRKSLHVESGSNPLALAKEDA